MTVYAYELAKKYFSRLWSKERIDALYEAGKLTEEEYKDILKDTEGATDE